MTSLVVESTIPVCESCKMSKRSVEKQRITISILSLLFPINFKDFSGFKIEAALRIPKTEIESVSEKPEQFKEKKYESCLMIVNTISPIIESLGIPMASKSFTLEILVLEVNSGRPRFFLRHNSSIGLYNFLTFELKRFGNSNRRACFVLVLSSFANFGEV